MAALTSMFATFVAFVSGMILIIEAVNKLFKVENKNAKLFISWGLSIAVAALAFWQQWGFFADCGDITTWQGWVKAALIGFGCAIAANKIYDSEEIWRLLEMIFSIFTPKRQIEQTSSNKKKSNKK